MLHAPNLPDKYVAENSGKDGIPVWMSDFFADEIEPIELAPWHSLCHNPCNQTERFSKI